MTYIEIAGILLPNFLYNNLETNIKLDELASTSVKLTSDKLSNIFRETTDKHAPQKKKKTRVNQSPFMTKELSYEKI